MLGHGRVERGAGVDRHAAEHSDLVGDAGELVGGRRPRHRGQDRAVGGARGDHHQLAALGVPEDGLEAAGEVLDLGLGAQHRQAGGGHGCGERGTEVGAGDRVLAVIVA
ncbi:MAG: hypothetical protein ACK559_02100, partial [bacterium]